MIELPRAAEVCTFMADELAARLKTVAANEVFGLTIDDEVTIAGEEPGVIISLMTSKIEKQMKRLASFFVV